MQQRIKELCLCINYLIVILTDSRVANYRNDDRHETQEINRENSKSEGKVNENRNVKRPCTRRCTGCAGE